MTPRFYRRAAVLVFSVLLAVTLGTPAARAETKYAYTTFDGTQAGFFSDVILGATAGNRYFGYRFKAQATGVLYYIQVGVRGNGATASNRVHVCLYIDAASRLGSKMGSWDLTAPRGAAFRFPIVYNPDANVTIRKGGNYWLTIEPADDDTDVEWLNGADKYPAETVRFSNDGFAYSHDSDTPLQPSGASTIAVETAYQAVIAPEDPVLKIGDPVLNEDGKTIGSIGAVAQIPLKGTVLEGRKSTPAIFAADGSVLLRAGGEAPGLAGSKITKLGEPCGEAVLVTLAAGPGSVTAATSQVLIAGLKTGPLRIAAREGVPITAPANTTIKSFGSIDGNGAAIFFTGKLAFAGANSHSDDALLVALGDGSVRVLVQEGQTFGATSVAAIATLIPAAGSPAEGRWRAAADQIGVKLTFASHTLPQQLFIIPAAAASIADWIAGTAVGDKLSAPLADAEITALGTPAFYDGGMVHTATLKIGPGGIARGKTQVLLRRAGSQLTVLAQSGDPIVDASGIAISGANFVSFKDPVCGSGGTVAFMASGTKASSGIFFLDGTHPMRSVALAGSGAPGGGHFTSFVSLILPDAVDSGPVFTAKLKPDAIVGISAKTTDGLWAVNDDGLQLLLREGAAITFDGGAAHVTAFTALTGDAGSLGAGRGLDDQGHVLALASFLSDDHKSSARALVSLAIP